jgi:hypothetical protein
MMLPSPRNPFPIRTPFRVVSDLYRMGTSPYGELETTAFIFDDTYPEMIAEKLRVLQHYPEHGRCWLPDDLDDLTACLWSVAEYMATDQPDYLTYTEEAFTAHLLGITLRRDGDLVRLATPSPFVELAEACFAHLQAQPPFERLCDMLALSVQEDLVIGRPALDDRADYMECLLVALPSHWIPLEKVGLSFMAIHLPIADSERLVAASDHVVQAISTKGPFVRYNWTLSTADWARNPATDPTFADKSNALYRLDDPQAMLEQLYLRVERQTTVPFLPHQRYLFAIRIYQHTMQAALTTDERRERLLSCLESIPPSTLEHRSSLHGVMETLCEALRPKRSRVEVA